MRNPATAEPPGRFDPSDTLNEEERRKARMLNDDGKQTQINKDAALDDLEAYLQGDKIDRKGLNTALTKTTGVADWRIKNLTNVQARMKNSDKPQETADDAKQVLEEIYGEGQVPYGLAEQIDALREAREEVMTAKQMKQRVAKVQAELADVEKSLAFNKPKIKKLAEAAAIAESQLAGLTRDGHTNTPEYNTLKAELAQKKNDLKSATAAHRRLLTRRKKRADDLKDLERRITLSNLGLIQSLLTS
jgi:chromosome segregation ATPase